jgi:hypothetical protein
LADYFTAHLFLKILCPEDSLLPEQARAGRLFLGRNSALLFAHERIPQADSEGIAGDHGLCLE